MSQASLKSPSGLEFQQPTGLFINNEFVEAKSGEFVTAVDPATGDEITKVHAAGEEDVNIAVAAARKAFKSWKKVEGYQRGLYLNKLADLIERDYNKLATIEAWDGGKALEMQAGPNVQFAVRCIRYFAGYADKVRGKTIEPSEKMIGYTLKEPLGVCGQIVPWNYPILMAIWKIAPALAMGNCVVLKLSEETPLSMLHVAALAKEAGIPAGVLNIINGYGRTAGASLASHPDINKVAFTGSTATGKTIAKLASQNMVPVTLECGGKSPLIIFEDADLDLANTAIINSLMANSGQTCTANSVLYVHEAIHDKFVKTLIEKIKQTSVIGDQFEKGTFHGPQISNTQKEKILGYIESGKEQGAKVVLGGGTPKGFDKGFYIEPTLFDNVTDDMKIRREEIFGPVGVISSFKDEEEVISRANDTEYGLGASVFTKDLGRAMRVSSELEAGQCWINNSNPPNELLEFGGYKQSGMGRELGDSAAEHYTQTKAVHVYF